MLNAVDTAFSYGRELIGLQEFFKVKEHSLHEMKCISYTAFLISGADIAVR